MWEVGLHGVNEVADLPFAPSYSSPSWFKIRVTRFVLRDSSLLLKLHDYK